MARRKGTGWEENIQRRYGFLPTSNSGSAFGDGDHRHKGGRFVAEAKDYQSKEGFSFDYGQLLKLQRQAALFGDGNWVRLMRNKHGDCIVAMNEGLFKVLLAVADGVVVCPECEAETEIDW